MARRSGGGSLIFLVLGIAWVASKCGGGTSTAPSYSAPSPVAEYASPAEPATQEMYVDAQALNQRASPGGPVVGRLAGGESVQVYERRGEWARVSPRGAESRWVSTSKLCSSPGCYQRQPSSGRAGSTRPSHRPRSNYRDDTCPCSGNNVCIGPRGGRYCITSGGNKRYGV